MIYLDNAATTRVSPSVLHAMLPYYLDRFGNPGSLHNCGRQAKDAVSRARGQVANLFNTTPDNIIFTSGGSESNNIVFHGLVNHLREQNKMRILISAFEHDSVFRSAKNCEKLGFQVDIVTPNQYEDYIHVESVERTLRDDTGLVSVMYVNNETGAVNDVSRIAKLCRDRGVLFHVDCVQAAGTHPLDTVSLVCDFASISSHKIHGPKGVGALYCRDLSILSPIIYGGEEQEFGIRSGTENVPGIVGFGKACELAIQENTVYAFLQQRFLRTLSSSFGVNQIEDANIYNNSSGGMSPLCGKILNLRVDGVNAESLVLAMDSCGVCISAGSACRSHESEPSRTLLAIGLTPEEARSSVRISFSSDTTLEEVEEAAIIMVECTKTLREGHYDD